MKVPEPGASRILRRVFLWSFAADTRHGKAVSLEPDGEGFIDKAHPSLLPQIESPTPTASPAGANLCSAHSATKKTGHTDSTALAGVRLI